MTDHDNQTQTETETAESEESADEDEEACPVCGQEYAHKREETRSAINHVLRDDFQECRVNHRSNSTNHPDTVYVHEPKDGVDISREKTVKHVHERRKKPLTFGTVSNQPGLGDLPNGGGELDTPDSTSHSSGGRTYQGDSDV